MRVAFFDETGRADSTEFVGMAACVGAWTSWQVFNRRWSEALVAHGAPYLHMREFAHFQGAFRGWDEARRRALMADCLAALSGLKIITFSAVLKTSDYMALQPQVRERLADPYLCLFQECLHGVALTGYLSIAGERVDVIYSQQDEFMRGDN